MALQLSPVETRVLGCLLEKERTTPENYPISLHSLTAGCNQSTNRDPVVAYEEKTVEQGIDALREKKLASIIHIAGARVPKYRHNLPDHYTLTARETAVLCVLMLRGPQTPGELRARTERLGGAMTLEEVESCLGELARGDAPLVRALPARPGQKERRYVQLLSGEPVIDETPPSVSPPVAPVSATSRLEELENEVNALRNELQSLREAFAEFRKQFE